MSRLTNPDWIAPHRARAYYLESNFPKYEEQCLFYNKLKEYENFGSVEEIVQKIHELEVYKKAMCMASETISALCPPVALGMGAGRFVPKDTEWFIEQAKKELGYE